MSRHVPSRFRKSRSASISSAAASCSVSHVVEAEDQQRVGIGEDAFVDRQSLAGLIDALVDRRPDCRSPRRRAA